MAGFPEIIDIADLDSPGMEPYRTLRRQADHLREGIFIAEGEKVVRRLLASGLTVRSMLLTPAWFESLFPHPHGGTGAAASGGVFAAGARIYRAPKKSLETIVGFNLHQGIMALAETPAETTLGELAGDRPAGARLYVALDDLVNAENVGLIVRNCAAFGVDAVICGETSSSPWLRRAVRASMGTVFGVRIHHSAALVSTLGALAARAGTAIVGADPSGSESLYATDLRGDVCIVLGHEGTGIRPAVLAACTHRAAIPMWKGTDSLNVGSACAVFLSEARRQRQAG